MTILLANTADEIAPSLVDQPEAVLAILLAILAALFWSVKHPILGKVFKVVPLLVFAYFVPTVLSNTGVIPYESPLYEFIQHWLLPASLFLLTLSVDIPGILRLGPKVLILFLGATAGIVIGAPIAYMTFGWLVPAEMGDQAWKGLAALSGSWIGGGANYIAIGESVGANSTTLSMIVVVDVAVASIWMTALLFFARHEKTMDQQIGADRAALDELRAKIEKYQGETARPTTLSDLLLIVALAFGVTVLAAEAAKLLPEIGTLIREFTWLVLIVTALGVVFSFTPLRKLDGAGASVVGSVFLYLLVTTIGAGGDFRKVNEIPGLLAVGAIWMAVHAVTILLLRWWLKTPIFFAAVGSQANVGGAASAPVVAGAFHPSLASVGALLAVAGYVLGTYAGLVCAFLLEWVHNAFYAG